MRHQPNLDEARLAAWLFDHYGLTMVELAFLPTGYEQTAAYRVAAADASVYFLKLRREVLDSAALSVPRFLSAQGLAPILAPISTRGGALWSELDEYNVILYPFVAGHNAFESRLTAGQWRDFGAALQRIHTTALPPDLARQVQHEMYSPDWRARVARLLVRAEQGHFADAAAAELAAFMRANASELQYLVQRCAQLSHALQARPPVFVLCHSDLHAGNLLLEAAGHFYLIDWDNPILAPKERDLMFIGGGVGGIWNSALETDLFYTGYGPAAIDPVALAYYRFARILEDIAPQAEQLLLTGLGGAARAGMRLGIQKWFEPQAVVAMAHQADQLIAEPLP